MTVLDVKFSDWIQEGFTLYVANVVILLVAGVVALVLSAVTLGLLAGPMLAGLAIIILNLLDNRLARPTINDLFKGFEHFLDTLPVTICFYALAVIAMVLNLIPLVGQILNSVVVSVGAVTGVLSIFHLVARRIPPRKSLPAWLMIFKDNWGPLLGFYILVTIIGGVGVLACGVGLLATVPLQMCILGVAYQSMARQSVEF